MRVCVTVPQFVLRPRNVTATECSRVVLLCAANGRDRHGEAPQISWLKDAALLDTM